VSCFCVKPVAEEGDSSGTKEKRTFSVEGRYQAAVNEDVNVGTRYVFVCVHAFNSLL
jgi:hypothetical protein